VRELPRQLSADELAELFEGRSRFVERLAGLPHPLEAALGLIGEVPEEELVEALEAHPQIGAKNLSERSTREQGPTEGATVETELAYLNQVYEEKFGFRFVVFVNRRPKSEIADVLRARLEHTREDELETAVRELIAIARDRWEQP
jgi:2-oxo-4-hydroxy-4-carboxy--5-ureidoimidazoline (OHCU) decarboxylase